MELECAVHIRSYPGAPRGGDAGVVVRGEDGALAALIDATGHGLTAYAVAQTARRALLETSRREPDAILQELDAALAGSIGAAISIAHIRLHEIAFAGVGNVSASVGLRPLLVRPGVVGRRMRKPTVVRVAFEPNTWLLMHTDGVSRPETIPAGDAETAARVLVEAKGSHHDDAGVLLIRWRERLP
jgi:hypothetical protein